MPLWLLVLVQVVVSAASLVVEIVAGRMLAPYVGMSLYTWTAIIAVVLAGFSAGHWWGGRIAGRGDALARTGWILLAAALTTAAAVVLLQRIAAPVIELVDHPVWAIVALCSAVFFLPSLFAGVPAPVLARLAVDRDPDPGRALGALFAAGALGAIAGTLLAGFLFISWLGSALTLAVVTITYLATAVLCLVAARALRWPAALATVAAIGAAGWSLAAPSPCDLESDYFCIRSFDVSADPARPVQLMVLDHLVHGMSAGHDPQLFLTPHAALLDGLSQIRADDPGYSSFIIGGGTFTMPRAIAARGGGPVTVAEIDPAVTEIAARDFWFDPASARVLHEDARYALTTRPDLYDVIVGDAFTDIAVPQHMITREFYALVRDRLEPDGSYLMNVIDFEDRLQVLGAVVRSLQEVFPVVEIWTVAEQPLPGQRMVFVVVAGDRPTPIPGFATRAPQPISFAALADEMVDQITAGSDLILTDDYAPIDRLIGFDSEPGAAAVR
ncbi:MAG: hypothetical protein HLUCCA08_17580 [Rhodobacteraceae bacterium HLUCCA08]|nr:MAG: hypothetical protein HLUCCA08_17580 [Rhodobacteraceae bacterium HLUCCA08]